MNSSFLISFGVCLGVYLSILGIISLVKYIKNKRLANKDKDVFDNEVK